MRKPRRREGNAKITIADLNLFDGQKCHRQTDVKIDVNSSAILSEIEMLTAVLFSVIYGFPLTQDCDYLRQSQNICDALRKFRESDTSDMVSEGETLVNLGLIE